MQFGQGTAVNRDFFMQKSNGKGYFWTNARDPAAIRSLLPMHKHDYKTNPPHITDTATQCWPRNLYRLYI